VQEKLLMAGNSHKNSINFLANSFMFGTKEKFSENAVKLNW
jgi:hypothetical protein